MYYHNANGLLTKLQVFYASILTASHQIYALTETALNDSVNSNEVFPSNFSVYRCDRTKNTSQKSGKGGTLIAVNKTLNSELILHGEKDGCEQIWIKISYNNCNIFIGSLYIPPQSSISLYAAHLNLINQIFSRNDSKDSSIILFGDFNLPNLKWEIADESLNYYTPINMSSEQETLIVDEFHELGLNQMNFHLNNNSRLLDLIWTNDPDQCTCKLCPDELLKNEIHHKAIVFEFAFNFTDSYQQHNETYLDFNNANYNVINRELTYINWDNLLHDGNLHEKTNKFYATINSIIKNNVQNKHRKVIIHPKWFDKETIHLKNQVNSAHKKHKKYKSVHLYTEYTAKRRQYKQYVRNRYREYKMEMQQLISDDPNQFFRHVKNSKKQSDDIPATMKFNNKQTNSEVEIAEFFRIFFESTYSQPDPNSITIFEDSPNVNEKIRNVCHHIPPVEINEQIVEKCLSQLPSNLVTGPDNLPNLFLRNCVTSIKKPIAILLKMSLMSATVPDIWKSSFIRPIFKNGNKNDVTNYRGVAVQCGIIKILDSIVAHHLNEYIKNIISDHQHGFLNGKSTITNLVDFTTSVSRSIDEHKQVDAIYLDISKAFDAVDCDLLYHKLEIMGLHTQLLNWIGEYLKGRKQLVRINSKTISNPVNVSSGVGQGYPIGATLFIMFMIDLPNYINNSSIHLFADDSKISRPITSIADCQTLQNDLDAANEYFKINRLNLNVKKTKKISFFRGNNPIQFIYTLSGSIIESVTEIRDLGVIINQKMTFNNHINHIVSKAKSRLAWIKRYSKEFDDPWIIKRLFETFVRPIVEYASPVWAPEYQIHNDRIESIQKQFLKFALRKFKWPHRFILPPYKHRLLFFHMNTLKDRRSISQILFIFSLIKSTISSSNLIKLLNFRTPMRFTRNTNLLNPSNLRDPLTKMIVKFNEHAQHYDFNLSVNIVKNNLKNFFKTNNL